MWFLASPSYQHSPLYAKRRSTPALLPAKRPASPMARGDSLQPPRAPTPTGRASPLSLSSTSTLYPASSRSSLRSLRTPSPAGVQPRPRSPACQTSRARPRLSSVAQVPAVSRYAARADSPAPRCQSPAVLRSQSPFPRAESPAYTPAPRPRSQSPALTRSQSPAPRSESPFHRAESPAYTPAPRRTYSPVSPTLRGFAARERTRLSGRLLRLRALVRAHSHSHARPGSRRDARRGAVAQEYAALVLDVLDGWDAALAQLADMLALADEASARGSAGGIAEELAGALDAYLGVRFRAHAELGELDATWDSMMRLV